MKRMRKQTLLKMIEKHQLRIPNADNLPAHILQKTVTLKIKTYLEDWFFRRIVPFCSEHSLLPPGRNNCYLPNSKLEFDFSWKSIKVAVEIQGGLHSRGGHTTATGIKRDMRKVNLAQTNGWILLQLSRDDIADNHQWNRYTEPLLISAIHLQRSRHCPNER